MIMDWYGVREETDGEALTAEEGAKVLTEVIGWGELDSYGRREEAWLKTAERVLKLPEGADLFDYYPEMAMRAHVGH